MKVKFISRTEAICNIRGGFFKENDCDLISISDTNSEKEQMRELWMMNKKDSNAALFFNFLDIEGVESRFDYTKAQKIIQFVQESQVKKKDIIVHCFAGISRSGAVAKFINEDLMLMDEYLENYAGHNKWVYYTLLEESGVETLRSFYSKLEGKS